MTVIECRPDRPPTTPTGTIHLSAGQNVFATGDRPRHAWQLVSGAVRLDEPDAGQDRFVFIALPGEPFGTEAWFDRPQSCGAAALTDCVLRAMPRPDANALADCLGRAMEQRIRRSGDIAALRHGSASERVRRLLLMLAPNRADSGPIDGATDHALPRLKDIATIVDAAPETVSRVLSCLRRSRVLQARHAQFARFDPVTLKHYQLPGGMTRSDTGVARPPAVGAVGR
jgi:CRP-like cAMP-binding protein